MTPVSRRLLKPQVKNSLINEFWYALGRLNRSEIEIFFKDILSPTETMVLSKRLEILKQLRNKYKYSDICDNIKVTDGTIARVNEKLQKGSESFLKILDYLIRDEKGRWDEYIENQKPHGHGKFIGGLYK